VPAAHAVAPHTVDVSHDVAQQTWPKQTPLAHCAAVVQDTPAGDSVVVVVGAGEVVELVVVLPAIVVVDPATISGAHRSFATLGVTDRSPN